VTRAAGSPCSQRYPTYVHSKRASPLLQRTAVQYCRFGVLGVLMQVKCKSIPMVACRASSSLVPSVLQRSFFAGDSGYPWTVPAHVESSGLTDADGYTCMCVPKLILLKRTTTPRAVLAVNCEGLAREGSRRPRAERLVPGSPPWCGGSETDEWSMRTREDEVFKSARFPSCKSVARFGSVYAPGQSSRLAWL
jgi:hypothetical protein